MATPFHTPTNGAQGFQFIYILSNTCYFLFLFFGPEARGILAPRQGTEPAPPALEGEVLTTGSPGKSLVFLIVAILMGVK